MPFIFNVIFLLQLAAITGHKITYFNSDILTYQGSSVCASTQLTVELEAGLYVGLYLLYLTTMSISLY